MAKHKDYMIPIVVVISILAVYFALYYLPTSIFGTEWMNDIAPQLWTYLPWLVVLAGATFTLVYILRGRK